MRTFQVWLPDDMEDQQVEYLQRVAAEAIAYRLHEDEAERKIAEFYNVGWGVAIDGTRISIASKTSHGILQTDYDSRTGYVEHTWSE